MKTLGPIIDELDLRFEMQTQPLDFEVVQAHFIDMFVENLKQATVKVKIMALNELQKSLNSISSVQSFANNQEYPTIFDIHTRNLNNTMTITPQPKSISQDNQTKVIDVGSNLSENSSNLNKSSISKTQSIEMKRT